MMANNKLWQTKNTTNLLTLVEDFTVGDDYIFDQLLLPYDIQACIAHAEMLSTINVLSKEELRHIKKGLNEILDLWQQGKFIITKQQEDGHTAIEQYLTEKYGEIGKKIHTGRSRNDQSLVMIRLFMKEHLIQIANDTKKLLVAFEHKINSTKGLPMPGYTHLQKAMPSTINKWIDSFAAAFKDFMILLASTQQIIDQNPLGSASGFGIDNFPINKALTTKKLKFKKVQDNPLYCGLSRGYFENIILQTLSQPMILAGKFANDMLLFTTQEFNFFSLPAGFTTGSSIMPQKKNYDIFEIMRGNTKIFNGYQNEIQNIVSSIGSGYQRDLQLTKKPFILGVNLCSKTIQLMTLVIKNIYIHQEQLKQAMTPDLYVTHEVYELVKQGHTFRDAYMNVKNNWDSTNQQS